MLKCGFNENIHGYIGLHQCGFALSVYFQNIGQAGGINYSISQILRLTITVYRSIIYSKFFLSSIKLPYSGSDGCHCVVVAVHG